jgi:hypothetical protein
MFFGFVVSLAMRGRMSDRIPLLSTNRLWEFVKMQTMDEDIVPGLVVGGGRP